jgi:hypothetical protein
LVLLLACTMAGMLDAQQPDGRRRSPLSTHVTGGVAVPVSPDPLAAGWKPGVMVGAAARYLVSRQVMVDVSFQYAQFVATPAAVIYDRDGNPVGSGHRTGTVYAGFAEVSWYPFPGASVVSPYVIGGFGYSGSNNFGSGAAFPVGGGLLLSVARRAALFGDARYVFTTGNSLRYATIRAGITLR